MPRILDYTGREAVRTVTVADIVALKASGRQLAQVTAGTAAEAAAAEAAGVEMVVCLSDFVPAVRAGSQQVFVTAAIDFAGAITEDDLLRDALKALGAGADAVITARGLDGVRRLAHEDIPVMGHLGFVPKKSTLYGGVRAVGKTAPEALALWQKFQALEEAGAFAVECELIPAKVMREIHAPHRPRHHLARIRPARRRAVPVHQDDICGESDRTPSARPRLRRPRGAAAPDRGRARARPDRVPRRRRERRLPGRRSGVAGRCRRARGLHRRARGRGSGVVAPSR